jgi:hypothetical protein
MILEKSEPSSRGPVARKNLATAPPKPLSAPVATLPATETVAAQPDVSSGIPLPGLVGAVRRVEIEFEIYTGDDRQFAGMGRHLYVSGNGEDFGVSIRQIFGADEQKKETEWRMEISGRITREGLSPLLFELQGELPERLIALKNIPEKMLPAKVRKGRMPDGILDRQSLIYQFMVKPPALLGGKLWLSDGITHGVYLYRMAGFDSLSITALGGVRAIKLIVSSSESAEIIELWVVPDMHYLPVKVRHTDAQGVVTEQLAISLDFKK